MKNKNGFTLVELLAVIVIIGLLGGIGALAYTSLIHQSEDRVFESYENTMHAELVFYLSKNVGEMPKNGSNKTFYLSNMLTKGIIDPIKNSRNKNDLCNGTVASKDSYIRVTRNNVNNVDSFTYKVCLICADYNSDESKCKTFEN